MAVKATKSSNVQLSTYMSWKLGDAFDVEVVEIDSRRTVRKVYCRSCRKHADKIRLDCRLKGQARKDCLTYAQGSTNVVKSAVTRHLTSLAHAIAVEMEQEAVRTNDSSITTSVFSSTENTTAVVKVEVRSDTTLRRQAEAYRRLIHAAYTLAVDGQPLSTFKTIVTCLKANDVKLIQGGASKNKAKEFIKYLANSVRSTIGMILQTSRSFGILCDGAQAGKTGREKQLVLVRVVGADGKSKNYVAGLQDLDSYGSANADNMKKSLDDTFTKQLELNEQQYRDKVVSITADGASVNELFVQMAADGRPWLLGIDCMLHRVELAIKDSLLQQKMFLTVKDLMIVLYTLMKQSENFQNYFHKTARELDVQVCRFPKVHGASFVGNQRKGLQVLLHNWVPLLVTIKKAADSNSHNNIKAKLTGVQRQLANMDILAAACFFKLVLDVIAQLSLKFEENKVQPFDVSPSIDLAVSLLEDLQSNSDSPVEMTTKMTLLDNVLSTELMNPGHKKRKMNDIETTGGTVDMLKHAVIPQIIRCIKERFVSFDHPIYRSMQWIDPANWTDDDSADLINIRNLSAHFSVHLAANKFSPDERKLARELKSLKRLVRHYYDNKPVSDVWQCILRCRRSELPNICMLVDVVMAMGVSNGFVESCFGFLSSMLSDRRLCLSHSTMADLLLIRANHLAWSEKEREDLINDTVNTYMLGRRKLVRGGISSVACSQPSSKTEAISSSDDTLDVKPDDLLPDSGGDDDEPFETDEDANADTDHSESSEDDFDVGDIGMPDSNIIDAIMPPSDSDSNGGSDP